MSEENESTPQEKLQAEYNHVVGLLGHNKAQRLSLKEEGLRLEDRILKIIKKAANLPKEQQKVEEVKNESASA